MPLYFSFLLFFSQRLPSGSPAGVFDLFWKCAESREDFAELNETMKLFRCPFGTIEINFPYQRYGKYHNIFILS